MDTSATQLLYQSGREGRVRLLTWGSALLLLLTWLAGLWVYQNLLVGEEGAELAPQGTRVVAGVAVAVVGAVPLAGMLVYRRYYVVRLSYRPEMDRIEIETLGLSRPQVRLVESGLVVGARYHQGTLRLPGQVAVDAPWHWVRVEGGRGFLLDGRGRFAESELLQRILSAKAG